MLTLLLSNSETEDNSLHQQNSKDNEALFYQPDKVGFYSPRPGSNSLTRLNFFRNVGRLVKKSRSDIWSIVKQFKYFILQFY